MTDKGLQTHFVPAAGSLLSEGTTNNAVRELDLNKADADHIHAATSYNANGLTVNTGTLASGNVASLYTAYDGNVARINEVSGTPGFDIEIDFSSISNFNEIHIRVWYAGGASHNVEIGIYNYTTVGWDILETINAEAGYTWHNFYIADDSDYLSGGNAIIRLYHSSGGNPSHVIYIDHVDLILNATGAGSPWDGDITDIDETSSADIGEALADTDQGIVYNASGSAWVRFQFSRIKTYIQVLTDTLYQATDGWVGYSAVTPTRASADDPTYVLTFASVDLTGIISVGMKLKWTQNSTVRYGIVTAISFSTNTTLTLYGGTDYDVDDTASFAISDFYYSSARAPLSFPLDPDVWSVIVTNTTTYTKTSPTGATWYSAMDSGSLPSIDIPIGLWDVSYSALARIQGSATPEYARVGLTLSTTTSTETDADTTTFSNLNAGPDSSGNVVNFQRLNSYPKIFTLAVKDTYYLLIQGNNAGTIDDLKVAGATGTTVLRARCAYL